MSHSQDVVQRLREDVVTKTNQREVFQAPSPRYTRWFISCATRR
jgi:Asp-tRNA(Asn)/Glu-tRNA(Gln) amidotransferase C subunit